MVAAQPSLMLRTANINPLDTPHLYPGSDPLTDGSLEQSVIFLGRFCRLGTSYPLHHIQAIGHLGRINLIGGFVRRKF